MTDTEQGFSLPSDDKRFGRRQGSSPVGDVAGVSLDQYKRYLLPSPSDPSGPVEPWTRVTTISGVGQNQDGLRVWTERKIMQATIVAPVLRSRLAVADPDDVEEIDKILEEAKVRGGVHDAAAEGTARHAELQRWVEQGADYAGPPPEVVADVTAAIMCVQAAGLEIHRVEALIGIESIRVAGRLDILAMAPNGKLRVLDWKTGQDVCSTPAKRAQFGRQLAPYANFSHIRRPDGTWQAGDELDIDREIAYIVHAHGGVAQLYEVPIGQAWREFLAAYILHRGNSAGGAPIFLPIGRPARYVELIEDTEPLPVTTPADWDTDTMTQLGRVLTGDVEIDHASMSLPASSPRHAAIGPNGEQLCGDYGSSIDPCAPDCASGVCVVAQQRAQNNTPAGVIACGPDGAISELPPEDVAVVVAFAEQLTDRHEFQPSFTGMVCERMVMRDGGGDQCGMAPDHSIHTEQLTDPADDFEDVINAGRDDADELMGLGVRLPELAPMADKSKGERGCGVCGRKGHKRSSPKCLGDADPAKQGVADYPKGDIIAGRQDSPFQAVAGPGTVDFCDRRCEPSAGLQPSRDDTGAVTGQYECSACGKRPTVAALRAHFATHPSGQDPPEDKARHERLVSDLPVPIEQPGPDAIEAQQEACKHSWSRSDGSNPNLMPADGVWWCPSCGQYAAQPLLGELEKGFQAVRTDVDHEAPEPAPPWLVQLPRDWDAYLRESANTQTLHARVKEMQDAGAATPERLAAATERWNYLNDQGA